MKNQCWSLENRRHYFRDLWDGNFIIFILDKDGREMFFEKSFLLADINPDVVFGMPFLTMINIDIDFQA